MGKITGFMETERAQETYASVAERLQHYREFFIALDDAAISEQGGRCMDCGIPHCQTGCPVNNIIPDWNDLVYHGDWRRALAVLHTTNNFPEFTGRICPAPCEAACTLTINAEAVTIKSIERAIVDYGWREGWITPQPVANKSGKKVAVIGSGPAGMACAQQLARAGHAVSLYEKNDRIGGLLRYGIPDFKMEKHLINKRMEQMRAEGVSFYPDHHIGKDFAASQLLADYDALALACGCEEPRDLPIAGRELSGVHFAMAYLPQQNRRQAGLSVIGDKILATDKHVVVIGGGDTGSDCIGTANRQGAKSVTQLELLQRPPDEEDKDVVWPNWPLKLRTSSSQEEGCDREWSVATKAFVGDENGNVKKLRIVRLQWATDNNGRPVMKEMPGSEFDLHADLALLAMGYVHPVHAGLLEELGVAFDGRGNVAADDINYQTSKEKIFVAGDTRRGQSLVVWAIREGRQCAAAIDKYLSG